MNEGVLGLARALGLVRELFRLEVGRMREAGIAVAEDEFRGLYTSDDEADRLLRGEDPDSTGSGDAAAIRAELEAFTREDTGRFGRLARTAKLDAFEAGCLLLCLASEVDLGMERLVGYVQDDVTKRRPRVDLALRLMGDARASGAGAFDPGSRLRRWRLVTVHDEPGQPHTPLRARYVALEPRVVAYLEGRDGIDDALQLFAAMLPASAPNERIGGDERVAALASLPGATLTPPVVAMSGTDLAAVREAAGVIASGSGLRVLSVQLAGLAADGGFESGLTLALREGALQSAAVLLEGVGELSTADADRLRTRLREEPFAELVLLASKQPFSWPGVVVEIPEPGFEGQRAVWQAGLADEAGVNGEELDAVAARFRLGTMNIENAVRAARGLATWRDPANPEVRVEDLYAAARTQSTPILSDLARKIVPHYAWDDIVLPADSRDQLREMCAHVEHRHIVYEVWGLGKRLAMGKGLMALFAGNSGTGKTMAADVIAGTLGLDLYKIDLSGVVSKYIGETEKNLGTIFDEASTSNAILFFDEADALFGKRSEVKDAHDRYANIETAYLLQKMEEYSGVVILATNLKMNLDEAFLRRLHFVIDFPMPDEDDRRRIWRTTMPSTMPIDGDVDIEFLARQFKIAGGNIRNIVLAAAFLAASDGTGVGMSHFIRGVRREYQKLGRMVTDAEFGPYVHLVRGPGNPNEGRNSG